MNTDTIYTTADAAAKLGISVPRVKQLAQDLQVGQKFGRSWLFTEDDITRMRGRNRTPGPAPMRNPHPEE